MFATNLSLVEEGGMLWDELRRVYSFFLFPIFLFQQNFHSFFGSSLLLFKKKSLPGRLYKESYEAEYSRLSLLKCAVARTVLTTYSNEFLIGLRY